MTTKPTATCRIDLGLMEELREYSKITGVPTNRCVEEAVARWLQTVAPTRIEAMQRQEVRFNENGVGSVFLAPSELLNEYDASAPLQMPKGAKK
jgi:hypothetical protein